MTYLVVLVVLVNINKSTWAPTFTTCATYCLIDYNAKFFNHNLDIATFDVSHDGHP